ncbi:hypothetical protein V5N11_003011 [Cardamine amara subsp. amara]|uniref:Reverse transcriptase domain-containing protein n=1 Tax=Cardamine amara subsp. amara TaxID=228776 RepID=A0ABD1ABH2_CARAN
MGDFCARMSYWLLSWWLFSIRMKFFTDDAVQINQVGFIHGRLLCENVVLASELVVIFNKDGETRRGCIHVDLAKAYDNLCWRYLLNILRDLELPDRFIRWINECFSTVWHSIALNGELVGFFPAKNGLRQGDPISSSLFAIAMNIFAKQLDKAAISDLFVPHPLCREPLITHLSFADDLLIFFDGTQQSLEFIMHCLDQFYIASGLKLNIKKSYLFLDGNNHQLTQSLAQRYGLSHGSLPVCYLGLPLLAHKLWP